MTINVSKSAGECENKWNQISKVSLVSHTYWVPVVRAVNDKMSVKLKSYINQSGYQKNLHYYSNL